MSRTEDKGLADTINDSARQGDHLRLNRLGLRALVGFIMIATGAIRRSHRIQAVAPVLLVIANGVAHGSRLARGLERSLPLGVRSQVIYDARFSSFEPADAIDAPGLSVRRIGRSASWRRVSEAWRLRRVLGRNRHRFTASLLYNEYIFFAQALRFLVARDVLGGHVKLVVTDFDRHAYAYPWIWAAHAAGARTVTAVHGTPSAATYLPVLSDVLLAWGPNQAGWFARNSPGIDVAVTGRFDVESTPIRGGRIQRVVLCNSCEDLQTDEVRGLNQIVMSALAADVPSVLRLHPAAVDPGEGWDFLQELCESMPQDQTELSSFLQDGDLVVGVVTSATIEAMMLGYPVLVAAGSERAAPADIDRLRGLREQFGFSGRSELRIREDYLLALRHEAADLVALTGDDARERTRAVLQAQLGSA